MTPLLFYRGFSDQFATIKLLLTESIVLAGCLFVILHLLWRPARRLGDFSIGAPIALLVLAVLLSCVLSPTPQFSFTEAGYFLCGPAWLLLLMISGGGELRVRWLAALTTASAAVVGGILVVQWAGYDPLLFGGYHVDWGRMVAAMRRYSTFGNPNLAAGYLGGAVFLAGALATTAKTIRGKVLCIAATLVIVAAIIGSSSSGAWAGLAVGCLVTLACLSRKPLRAYLHVGSFLVLPGVIHEPRDLLTVLEGRTFLWRASWPMFPEHPIFGSGWGSFQLRFPDLQARFLSSHPEFVNYWTYTSQLHNDPLQLLFEAGAVGLAALAWLLWVYGREVRGYAEHASQTERLWLAASAGGVTSMLVNAIFNFQFAVPPTLILLFTLLAVPSMLRSHDVSYVSTSRPPSMAFRSLASLLAAGAAVWLGLGIAHRALADHSLALGLEEERRGDMVQAERYFREGLEQQPSNGGLNYGLARALYLQEQYPEALAETLQAERNLADSHLEVLKARIQDQLGQRSPALEAYRHALWLDPALNSVRADIERLSNPNP